MESSGAVGLEPARAAYILIESDQDSVCLLKSAARNAWYLSNVGLPIETGMSVCSKLLAFWGIGLIV
jgi:hypothetical protein